MIDGYCTTEVRRAWHKGNAILSCLVVTTTPFFFLKRKPDLSSTLSTLSLSLSKRGPYDVCKLWNSVNSTSYIRHKALFFIFLFFTVHLICAIHLFDIVFFSQTHK